MDIKEKASALTESAKSRWTEDRNDRMARDVERLKTQNQALREELDRDRGRLSELLDTLADTSAPKVKKHRIRRFVTLTSAVAGAYVLGSKAGRERYAQIKEWARNLKGKGSSMWENQDDAVVVPPPADELVVPPPADELRS